jgi:hypothetical protein
VCSGGEQVGTVKEVLAAAEQDIFEGLIISTASGVRYADEEVIEEIYEFQVVLTEDLVGAERLPEPAPSPAVLGVGPDVVSQSTGAYERDVWFKRIWNRLSGKY